MARAILVLGMHRSGTSCLAGMLAAAGAASAGEAVRNWDNARGHFEMLDVVRLNEAVLAYSGGHWLAAPPEIRWTAEHAAARDLLMRATIDGRPALLKDPRTLLTLPFWRASDVPFHAIGIVRHPLAVARSLESWREMPLAAGLALWTAHNRALVEDRARHTYPLVDFEQPKAAMVGAVIAAGAELGLALDEDVLADAYEEPLIHHDHAASEDVPGLGAAIALWRQLVGDTAAAARTAFPRSELAAFMRLVGAGQVAAALEPARAALAAIPDRAAVMVPIVTALVRHHAYAEARELIAAHPLDGGLTDLLHGKVLLAMGDAAAAGRHLDAACSVAQPHFQARQLRAQALRRAGRHAEARAALMVVAEGALYPHGPLATLAEWSWLDGEHATADAEMAAAIEAAPLHRRGRLRTRRAEWLLARGEREAARRELELALVEDPAYPRSREVRAMLRDG